ncbi:hypothetical protein T484DRAFT_1824110 [Baffinella frigidus]|nr:hypothetical protein T484DRAFT_1824110 [Cryptophyta sp. CCMP2293]
MTRLRTERCSHLLLLLDNHTPSSEQVANHAPSSEQVFTWDALVWARGVFDTRCVTVSYPGGRDLTCLVPLVDMCNHDFCAQLSKPKLATHKDMPKKGSKKPPSPPP